MKSNAAATAVFHRNALKECPNWLKETEINFDDYSVEDDFQHSAFDISREEKHQDSEGLFCSHSALSALSPCLSNFNLMVIDSLLSLSLSLPYALLIHP